MRLKHCFQLPVGALFVIGLQAFQTLGADFAGTRAGAAGATRQQETGLRVIRIAFQNAARKCSAAASKSPLFHSA